MLQFTSFLNSHPSLPHRLRLNRLFEENKVHLGSHPDGKSEDWFNIFILHQNRAKSEEQEGKAVSEERIGQRS